MRRYASQPARLQASLDEADQTTGLELRRLLLGILDIALDFRFHVADLQTSEQRSGSSENPISIPLVHAGWCIIFQVSHRILPNLGVFHGGDNS